MRNHLHSIENQVNALEDAKKLLEGKVNRYAELLDGHRELEEQHEKA